MIQLTNDEIQILRNIRIHRIIGLPDNGRNVKLRCPFHNERTPSFVLYCTNDFYCFGCGASGKGSISFLMKLGCSFMDSLKELTKYI